MAISRHADAAAKRYEEAAWRVDLARQKRASGAAAREWLEALTELVLALGDVEHTNAELVQERLDLLARFVGIDRFVSSQVGRRRSPRPAPGRRRQPVAH